MYIKACSAHQAGTCAQKAWLDLSNFCKQDQSQLGPGYFVGMHTGVVWGKISISKLFLKLGHIRIIWRTALKIASHSNVDFDVDNAARSWESFIDPCRVQVLVVPVAGKWHREWCMQAICQKADTLSWDAYTDKDSFICVKPYKVYGRGTQLCMDSCIFWQIWLWRKLIYSQHM